MGPCPPSLFLEGGSHTGMEGFSCALQIRDLKAISHFRPYGAQGSTSLYLPDTSILVEKGTEMLV